MIFKKKPTTSTGRRRLIQDDAPKTLNKRFLYRSQRSETALNVGREVQREERASSRKARRLFHKTGMFVLLIAVIVSAANVISLSVKPKVLPLDGDKSGAFLRDTQAYEDYAGQLLSSSLWNRNKITVNTTSVSEGLVTEFPELSSASLTVPLLAHRPIIYVQPAKPVLVISARNGAFVVAETGKALLRANTAAELDKYKLPQLNDQSGLKLQVGHQALQSRDVRFIQTVLTELASKQFTVASMVLPATSSELDVQITGQPYIIKFNLQSDTARQQTGTFLSTIAYLKKQNALPSKYVDVRVDGRAYYQ